MRLPSRHPRRHWSWWASAGLCAIAVALIATYIALRIDRPRHDLVIRDAMIHDGSGASAYRGSIAIDADRITKIYPYRLWSFPAGRTTIFAKGLDVAPGFIDTHTHAD